jgi:ubiquinone biosynthesis protein
VVKVRRPGVVAQINEDLEIMAELDYLQEARNAERFAANFAGDARSTSPG